MAEHVADPSALAAALRSLYAVPPEEFMAERKRLVAEAKADGDPAVAKEIGTLRKPSLAAWAVNLLAREAPDWWTAWPTWAAGCGPPRAGSTRPR